MTATEFNEKYKKHIPKGWYGLGFDIPEITEMLDEEIGKICEKWGDAFEIHQIKLKFNMPRVYTNLYDIAGKEESMIENVIEKKISELLK
jgi:hypothetical protein